MARGTWHVEGSCTLHVNQAFGNCPLAHLPPKICDMLMRAWPLDAERLIHMITSVLVSVLVLAASCQLDCRKCSFLVNQGKVGAFARRCVTVTVRVQPQFQETEGALAGPAFPDSRATPIVSKKNSHCQQSNRQSCKPGTND